MHHPDEIGEIFDEVSYSKGASVIRMLADYLGEKDFRDGLRHYLKKHSYKNTETTDLWRSFEKISGLPVARMMKTWTGRPGYPVVKVELRKNQVSFSQKRFFINPLSEKKVKDKTKWEMPLNYKKNKLNYGEAGFFRSAYDSTLLQKLKGPVEKKEISARDRLGIVRDLFALSEAGIIPTTDALSFLSAYRDETNYAVWVEIALGLGKLEQILTKRPIKKIRGFIINLFSPVFRKVGWEKKKGEHHTDTMLRSLLISRLGRSGEPKVIKKTKKYFAKIKKGGHISPDIRSAIYSITASSGDKKEFEFLIKKYKKETLHEEKNRIGVVLGDFKQKELLKRTCVFSMSKDVRPQDTMSILGSVAGNHLGRDIWMTFIKKNWKTLVSRYGDGGHQLARLVKAISGSAEEHHLKDFKKFFATHDAPGAKRAIEQVLERLEGNILWKKRDYKKIERFVKN